MLTRLFPPPPRGDEGRATCKQLRWGLQDTGEHSVGPTLHKVRVQQHAPLSVRTVCVCVCVCVCISFSGGKKLQLLFLWVFEASFQARHLG